MRSVRILRLIARMNIGGPAIQITGLIKNLPAQEFTQNLVIGYCERDEVDYLDVNQVDLNCTRIEGFGRSLSLLSDLKALAEIRREIRAFSPDIIHTHTFKAGFLGRIAAISTFKTQVRVHTFHGHLLHGYFGRFKTQVIIWIERILAFFTTHLIAVGSQVRDELISAKIGKMQNYTVIGPGLEIGELPNREISLKSFGIAEDKFVVSWIGRVVAVKAPHRILEIANECKVRSLNVEFVVAGDGPLLNELKEHALSKNLPITFLGWQSNIESILSISDLVMLTSINEGTPVSLIQAQMARIPVLSTDVGSVSEVMINNRSGFCLMYSAKTFADKIELLANDDELRSTFGTLGRANALEKFSLRKLVFEHRDLYRKLFNQSNS